MNTYVTVVILLLSMMMLLCVTRCIIPHNSRTAHWLHSQSMCQMLSALYKVFIDIVVAHGGMILDLLIMHR